jgi:Cft2 family RNA processing exonuclease
VTRHVTWDRGVSLVDHDLWLDPLTVRDVAFVSHAHSDHTRRHKLAFLTADTLTLLTDGRRPHNTRVLELGDEVKLGSATISLHDAGHMLGSAQLLFEHCGCRLLYTGDLKLRRAAGRATPVPSCEVLVLESTYGRPHFRFPEPDSATEQVALWCRRALDARATPVVLAHALGKAQEIMLALEPYGFRFALEERCVPFARAYEEAGVRLPDWVELVPEGEDLDDRVVISPPAGKDAIRRLGRYRTALVSGWAQDPDFRRLFGADYAFPLSDHCDFDELLDVVRQSGADHVYTVHGFADDLARHLRRRGVRAHALHVTEQLQLAL